jgi:hypothetical protein
LEAFESFHQERLAFHPGALQQNIRVINHQGGV